MWSRRFLKRHPEYVIIKQKTIEVDRKISQDPDNILKWFRKFEKVCQEKGILPEDTYNVDESGFRVGIGRDQWIVTRDPRWVAYLASSSVRDLVTAIEVVSADGEVLPVMVILSGVQHLESWYRETALEDDTLIGVSDTGYNNDELALAWLRHFDRFSALRQRGVYRLLSFDGFGSHCTREFLHYCEKKKIIPFCLPPHTTHLLQPLDVVLFQPYKHYHAEKIDEQTRTGCEAFTKVEFLHAIADIRKATFKSNSIRSAFRKTGLVPYNPDMVLVKLRESMPESPSLQPSTPPRATPPPMEELPTPHTVRTLQRHAALLQETPLSPTFRHALDKYIKGSVAQALSGALAKEDLLNTKTAEIARASRKNGRRVLQSGGTLYACNGRETIRKRDQDEIDKAENALLRAQT